MKKLLLASTFFFFTLNATTFGQCHPDYDALMALYNATDGANWVYNDGWVDGAAGNNCDVCDWDYVSCNSSNRVTGINMFSNGSMGTLPPEIGDLEFLESLNLSYFNLTGTIPTEIGQLTNLVSLRLTDNDFTGSIPASIGNLVNLETLNLGLCHTLEGSLPSIIGNLTQLTKLFIHDTNVSGSLPATLGNLVNVEWIEFSSNEFTGTIPAELGNLAAVEELDLSNNNLTGSIPGTLSQLSNIFYLGLDQNDLSGCIPNALLTHCSTGVTVDIAQNPNLPGGGDFTAFCDTGAGACEIVSTTEITLDQLKMYPNPAKDVFIIPSPDIDLKRIVITSIYGQKVLHLDADPQLTSVDISVLSSGMYIVTGFGLDGIIAQGRLIVSGNK